MRKAYKQLLTLAVFTATVGGTSWAATVPEALNNASWPTATSTVSTNGLTGYVSPDAAEIARVEGQQIGKDQTFDATLVPAQYVSGLDTAKLAPFVGKRITSISVAGVPTSMMDKVNSVLTDKVGDTISQAGVEADISSLGNLGVFAEVNPVFQKVPEGVKVIYQVTANPVVKAVEIDGNSIYAKAQLVKFLNVPIGKVLNTVEVGRKAQAINAAYTRDGYMLAHVNGTSIDNNGVLHLSVTEGVVEDIIVKGNTKTKSYVVTREMLQRKGQPLNKFLARRSLQRVYNLGYFADVNMQILPGTTPDKIILEIDVVEQKTGVITVGAGYSKSNGFSGLLEVGENNFRGTGDKVKLHWEFGGGSGGGNYSLSYTRPWLDKKATSLGVSLYNRKDAYTDYKEDGTVFAQYQRKSRGLSATLGRQTGLFSRAYVTLETRKDTWVPPTTKNQGYYNSMGASYGRYPDYLKKNFGRTNSIGFQRVYDSRDNVYDPHHGKYYAYGIQYAGLGGNFNFWKFNGEVRGYKAVGKDGVIAMRLGAGIIKGDAAYSQLFTVGGSNTLRGYEDDQFRGQKYYNATVEYRKPLFKKVEGVIFVDVGAAWDHPNVPWYKGNEKFHIGYGPGLRIQTPIGPVRLDYGFRPHGKAKFTFAFGGQF